MPPAPDPTPILPLGSFLGKVRRTQSFDTINLCEVVDRADENIPLHTHSDAHFFLLLRGRYVTNAAGIDGVCDAPTLLFLPRWTTHRDHFETRGGAFFAVSVQPELLDRLAAPRPFTERAAVMNAPQCRILAQRIYSELADGDDCSPLIMTGLTFELLGWAARAAAPREHRQPQWLRRAVESIHDAPENLTVTSLAAMAGVHPFHFAKVFRRFHGCSPGEYLRARRVEHACRLLAQTRLPIAEVAIRGGFSDQSALTKAVRRFTGLTPAAFRRASR
jgi:AraC family transcriptional regulator